MEWLTPSSLSTLKSFQHTLSVLLNEDGGIIDDTIICKHSSEKYYVVTNAGCRERDLDWIRSRISIWNSDKIQDDHVNMKVLGDWGLVALQGIVSFTMPSIPPF